MKKRYFLFVILIFVFICVSGEENNSNQLAKNAIEIVRLARLVWSGQNMQPDSIVYEQNTNKIVKQYFINPSSYNNKMFDEVQIVWNGDKIRNMFLNGNKLGLEWDKNNKISRIVNPGYSDEDLYLAYEETDHVKGAIFKGTMKGVFIIHTITYNANGEIVEIDTRREENKKLSYFYDRKFAYSPDTFYVKSKSYVIKTIKKPPVIKSESHFELIKKEPNHYQFVMNGVISDEKYFDQKNRINKENIFNAYETRHLAYEYKNDSLFRSEELVIRKDSITFHSIKVHFSLTQQDPQKPVYDQKKGDYRLDSKGNLIRESQGTLYRDFINGYWTEWRSYTY